jgi:hypothetical protein
MFSGREVELRNVSKCRINLSWIGEGLVVVVVQGREVMDARESRPHAALMRANSDRERRNRLRLNGQSPDIA